MRTSPRRFLFRVPVIVYIIVLLTVGNLVFIPFMNPSKEQQAAREERQARMVRREKQRIEARRAQQK
jgi:hypothetical protein